MAAKPDLSEFFKYSRPRRKPCAIGFLLEQLEPAEHEKLKAALAHDPGIITGGAIMQWAATRGHDVNASAVTSHRRQTCTCTDG